jgi:glycosyltransferase involved in cell wall biosynthesis
MPANVQPRILYIADVPPLNWCGGCVVMHRLLAFQDDFDVTIATDLYAPLPEQPAVDSRFRVFSGAESNRAVLRLMKTRFWNFARSYKNVLAPLHVSSRLLRECSTWRPDAIFALADSGLSWLGLRLARRLRVPLAVYFADWTPKLDDVQNWTRPILERRFRKLYKECDLAFCTSEGMRDELGGHPNSHVLYPMPNPRRASGPDATARTNDKFTLTYAGNVQGFYGKMVSDLVVGLADSQTVTFRVYGPKADWPQHVLDTAARTSVYQGFVPSDRLAVELHNTDALLVVMSFDPSLEWFMKTSFTTKFLDYCAFGKPIVIWGPEYCMAVRFAQENGGAVTVTRNSTSEVVKAVEKLAADPVEQMRLGAEAAALGAGLFNPENIYEIFRSEMMKLLPASKQPRPSPAVSLAT